MTPAPDSETIGQRLRRLRTERGLSQRELAAPGVSYAYISRIEAGTRQPSVKALRKLATKLGVSPDYLETGSPVRGEEARELRIADAELELRMGSDPKVAEQRLQELLDEATASADPAAATRIRIALGFAAAADGRHADAAGFLEDVVDEGLVLVTTRPDVLSALGLEYAALGQVARAVELYERCLSELTGSARDDPAAVIRFSTLLSYALSDLGELDRAREILEHALEDTRSLTDPYAQVRVNWSLARLESMKDEQGAALRHARKALALLEATEDTLHLARAHQLCGSILRLQGAPEAAAEHLAEAERLLGARPERSDLASLRSEQAKVAADLGQGTRAVVLAREATAALEDDDPAERGAAAWALARGLALEGDLDGADAAFREAVDLLGGSARRRDVKLAADDWGRLLGRVGRGDEADAVRARFAESGRTVKTGR